MPTLKLNKIPNHDIYSVTIRVAQKPYDLILDTGAEHSFFSPDLLAHLSPATLARLALNSQGMEYSGCGGTERMARVPVKFNFCGVIVRSITVHELPSNEVTKCSGLIGNDILMQFSSVQFNYRELTVRFVL